MKVDKDVQERLVKNLKNWQKELNEGIDGIIEYISKADTVEQIMRAKKNLLCHLLKRFPLTAAHCYFCLKIIEKELLTCEHCPYAKKHKICDEDGSDYFLIKDSLKTFYHLVQKLYYKDETYDEQ